MRKPLILMIFVALSLGLAACGGEEQAQVAATDGNNGGNNAVNNGGNNTAVVEGPSWHADVKPLLEQHCNNCHVEGGIGPFTFNTYEDAFATRAAIKTSVMNGTMPPWHASPDCNEFSNDQSMDAAARDMLVRWVDTGAREGDAAEAPQASQAQLPPAPDGLSRVDMTLSLPEPYTPKSSPDDYRCFIVDWPETEEKFVTGFHVRPGNARIAHHVIAFLATPDRVAEFEALDASEEGPGYTCFGGPGGEDDVGTRWVGAWAPGSSRGDFPEGTGIRMEPGSKIILQMHYNTLNSDGGSDLTAMDFKIDDAVEKEAILMPFANPAWVISRLMPIAPGDADATHSYKADPTTFLPFLSDGRLDGDSFVIHSAAVHMHSVGLRGHITHIPADRTEESCLLDVPRWDFDWQRTYAFKEPRLFKKGDQLSLTCTWDNSQENQPFGMVDTDEDGVPDTYQQLPTQRRNWGDSTTDEMCLGIFYVTEP